jgi:hypothetical protein
MTVSYNQRGPNTVKELFTNVRSVGKVLKDLVLWSHMHRFIQKNICMNVSCVLISLNCFVNCRNIHWLMWQNDHLSAKFVIRNSNTPVISNSILSFTQVNNQARNHMNAKYVVKHLWNESGLMHMFVPIQGNVITNVKYVGKRLDYTSVSNSIILPTIINLKHATYATKLSGVSNYMP